MTCLRVLLRPEGWHRYGCIMAVCERDSVDAVLLKTIIVIQQLAFDLIDFCALCCSVLQYVAVCCSSVLQCVAVCCSVCASISIRYLIDICVLCCSVLQCVAVCCSVLQCVCINYYSISHRYLRSEEHTSELQSR